MKNKGFTLIELLAVIIVLAIIMVLTIPNVVKAINETKDEAMITYSKKLIKGATEYAFVHQDEFQPFLDEWIDKYDNPEILRGTSYITFYKDEQFKELTGDSSKYEGLIQIFNNGLYAINIREKDYSRCVIYNNVLEEGKEIHIKKGMENCKPK